MSCQNLEVVTNVTTETTQLQQSENTSFIAKVARRPFRECVQRSSALTSVVSHGDQAGLPSSFGSTSSIPGGSGDDVYDGEDRRGHSQAAWSTQPEAMGFDDHGRGKAQEQDLQAGQRLGSVFQNFVIKAWDQSQVGVNNVTVGAARKPVAPPKKMEVKDWSPEEEDELIFVEEEGNQIPVHPLGAKPKAAAQAGKRQMSMGSEENMNAAVSPELVSQLRLQIALLQDQLARVTKNTKQ